MVSFNSDCQGSHQQLLAVLRSDGPLSPATLMSRLNMSQSTLFRAAQTQSENIIALGAPRNRKLAALRVARDLGSNVPVFLISPDGELVSIGEIITLYPSTFLLMDSKPSRPQLYPGLPFFLDDTRPQGFSEEPSAKGIPI